MHAEQGPCLSAIERGGILHVRSCLAALLLSLRGSVIELVLTTALLLCFRVLQVPLFPVQALQGVSTLQRSGFGKQLQSGQKGMRGGSAFLFFLIMVAASVWLLHSTFAMVC